MENCTPNRKICSSACGKAILTGEHFVVWGGTALAVPLFNAKVRVTLNATPAPRNSVSLLGDLANDPRMLQAVRKATAKLLTTQRYSLSLSIHSSFPISSGLGGSAAFSVALCKILLKLSNQKPNEDLVAQLALGLEKVFHGHPSGIDSTTIAFATPCFVKTGPKFLTHNTHHVKGPLAGFLHVPPGATLILASSGKPGDTRTAIQKVWELARKPGGELVLQRLTAVADTISLQTASALKTADFPFVGSMMDENHLLLRAIGVSTPEIDSLVNVAKKHGALGAKLTGGGLGGFIIALSYPDQAPALAQALKANGSPIIIIQHTDQFQSS